MQISVNQREKGVIQCKKCAIHHNKHDIRQEKQADKNCHYEKITT